MERTRKTKGDRAMATITTTTLPSSRRPHSFGARIAVAVLGMLAIAGLVASPASALLIRGVVPGGGGLVVAPPDPCQLLPQPQVVSFSPNYPTIPFGSSAILSWNVQVPSGCNYTLYVNGQRMGLQGSLQVQPLFDTTYPLTLQWGPTLTNYTTASAAVSVAVPVDPTNPTRNLITISSQQMVPMFVRALGTPNTTVIVNADLDLTGLPNIGTSDSRILIADGVHLIGWRSAVPGQPFLPGPLLSVTDVPSPLFEIRGDNVRVTGVRIQGPSTQPDNTTALGIWITDVMPGCGTQINVGCGTIPGHVNVEIDHNEFSGWSDTAISVSDRPARIYVAWYQDNSTPAQLVYYKNLTTEPVWIHDNFFHHNLHSGSDGYGVAVGGGAHALIERNVFDNNRHAITSAHNDPEVGYRAYRNLVLPSHGTGEQQFDMHGSLPCKLGDSCFPVHSGSTSWWLGIAGRDFDIRYNSFLYKDGPAVLLRGTPSLNVSGDATMRFNVFAHDNATDAVQWTEGPPTVQDNLTGRTTYYATNTCDFDGDGNNDLFLATEQTLWYCPWPSDCVTTPGSGKATWVYLNMSTKRVDQLALGHFSPGGRVCDVVDGNLISVGGSGPWKPMLFFRAQ